MPRIEGVSPARAGMDSNRPVGESGRVFGDDVVATAILERPLHHSHLITIRGEATGFARSRRSGLFRSSSSILSSSAESAQR